MDISAEKIDEMRQMLGKGTDEAIPKPLIASYRELEKRKSRCCSKGFVTPEELAMLVTFYEAVTAPQKDFEIVCDVSPSQDRIEPVEASGDALVDSDCTIAEGSAVCFDFKGEKGTGTVLNVNTDHVRVKVDGDKMKFRKFDISDLELKKE